MRILQSSIVLFFLMDLIAVIHADTVVSLFKLLDSQKNGRVIADDVDRVNNIHSIGDENDVASLKQSINANKDRQVVESEFLNILRSLPSINENIDLTIFQQDKSKSYFTKQEVKNLLGIDDGTLRNKVLRGFQYKTVEELAGIIQMSIEDYSAIPPLGF